MKDNSTYYDMLISKHFTGETTDVEEIEIQELISKDEEFSALYRRYEALWFSPKELEHKKSIDIDTAIDSFLEKTSSEADIPKIISENKNKKKFLPIYKIAGIILLTIGISAILKFSIFTNKYLNISSEEYPLKEQSLEDGSIIHLNEHSTIKIPEKFNNRTREIYLEGEAYFEVKQSENLPFIIHTKEIDITVLGTSFNVMAYADSSLLNVTVDEGSVAVLNPLTETKCIIYQGESAVYDKKTKKCTKETNNNQNNLFWKTNVLQFDKVNFYEATQIIEKSYGVKFKFENDSLKNCRLTTEFKNCTFEEIIQILNAVFEIKITKQGEFYVISDL